MVSNGVESVVRLLSNFSENEVILENSLTILSRFHRVQSQDSSEFVVGEFFCVTNSFSKNPVDFENR
jgi:hypothetical protein